jgi:prolyl-tRNA editing enzyme YbaK/EbsC (Cys-tRNA(Pro) deacylase)
MEQGLLQYETVGINGGKRGLIVFLTPAAVRDALGARVTRLASGASD